MSTRPPSDLAGWVRHLEAADIPVLHATVQELALWREHEDSVDVRCLEEVIAFDPLMTLKLLSHTAKAHGSRRQTDVETTREALVLLGITPFFAALGAPTSVEDSLAARPDALAGLREVLTRARRAGHFALGFASHRLDPDAGLLYEAALLHDLAEMLLWCHAPDTALAVRTRLDADATLRSQAAQREVLGTTLTEIQQVLMRRWHLPDVLLRATADSDQAGPQERLVTLAVRLARHTAHGWDNAAIPDDVTAIAALLNLGEAPTRRLLADLDA